MPAFETLRAAGYSDYGGASLGEVLATARRVRGHSAVSWWTEWSRLADRIERVATGCEDSGHVESARRAYLRASNYHRTAEFFLRQEPYDARALGSWHRARDCFASLARLTGPTITPVEIPYQDTTLPGYLLTVDTSGQPRPTIIFHGGFDSIVEELYLAGGAAAVAHGYTCLIFDGPGQGRLIREQGLPFRPDWEHVLTPVLDWALRRPEVDADAVALMGMSLGGYLAPRAAAFEPRLAALVAYDGMYDFYDTVRGRLPAPVLHLVEQGPDAPARAAVRALGAMNATARWSLGNGAWTFGVAGALEFLRAMPAYTLAGGVAERISCPTLVLAAQRDHLAPGQAELLRQHLTAPASLVRFTADEGAGEHCQEGAMAVLHQRVFDWLDETLEHGCR